MRMFKIIVTATHEVTVGDAKNLTQAMELAKEAVRRNDNSAATLEVEKVTTLLNGVPEV